MIMRSRLLDLAHCDESSTRAESLGRFIFILSDIFLSWPGQFGRNRRATIIVCAFVHHDLPASLRSPRFQRPRDFPPIIDLLEGGAISRGSAADCPLRTYVASPLVGCRKSNCSAGVR
jgi:hypothetical protein